MDETREEPHGCLGKSNANALKLTTAIKHTNEGQTADYSNSWRLLFPRMANDDQQ